MIMMNATNFATGSCKLSRLLSAFSFTFPPFPRPDIFFGCCGIIKEIRTSASRLTEVYFHGHARNFWLRKLLKMSGSFTRWVRSHKEEMCNNSLFILCSAQFIRLFTTPRCTNRTPQYSTCFYESTSDVRSELRFWMNASQILVSANSAFLPGHRCPTCWNISLTDDVVLADSLSIFRHQVKHYLFHGAVLRYTLYVKHVALLA